MAITAGSATNASEVLSGFSFNGQILPSVAGGTLTVSVKTLAGNNPSAGTPVYARIGTVVRSITSA